MATKCDMPLAEYIFGKDVVMKQDVLEDTHFRDLIHWVRARGPQVPPLHASGQEQAIAQIWDLARDLEVAGEDLDTKSRDHDKLLGQIPKAKSSQLARMGGRTGVVDDKVKEKIEDWAKQKVQDSEKQVASQVSIVTEFEGRLQIMCEKLLRELQGAQSSQAGNDLDAELMADLDDFVKINLGDVVPETRVLDAQSVAMQHVMSLEDGPQKKALMAVLEAAMVQPQAGFNEHGCTLIYIYMFHAISNKQTTSNPSMSWFCGQVAPKNLEQPPPDVPQGEGVGGEQAASTPALAAAELDRKDTTQLEATRLKNNSANNQKWGYVLWKAIFLGSDHELCSAQGLGYQIKSHWGYD